MVSHDSFWIAIATAAPIVALANTATITDLMNVYFDQRTRTINTILIIEIVVVSSISLIAQGIVLYVSLQSLLIGKDYLSPRDAESILIGGLAIVLYNVLWGVAVRRTALSKKREGSVTPEPDTSSENQRVATGLGWPITRTRRSRN